MHLLQKHTHTRVHACTHEPIGAHLETAFEGGPLVGHFLLVFRLDRGKPLLVLTEGSLGRRVGVTHLLNATRRTVGKSDIRRGG